MKISKLLKHLSLVLLLGVASAQAKKVEDKKVVDEKVMKIDKTHEAKHEICLDKGMVEVLNHIKKDLRGSGKVLNEVVKDLAKEENVISHEKALRLMVELKGMKINLDKDSQDKLEKFEDIVNDAKEDTPTRRKKNKSYCNVSVRNALCANLVRANCINANSLRVSGNSNLNNTTVAPGSTLNVTGVNVVGLPEPIAPTSRTLWAVVTVDANGVIQNVDGQGISKGSGNVTLEYNTPFVSEPSVTVANNTGNNTFGVQNNTVNSFDLTSGDLANLDPVEGTYYVQVVGPAA